MRAPFAGVWNIVRFNWHFYAIAGVVMVLVAILAGRVGDPFQGWIWLGLALAAAQIALSLLASYLVYDRSDLYALSALDGMQLEPGELVLNIHAGFDETSTLLARKFPEADLRIWDFYDPGTHTEPSIRRARAAYPPHPDTVSVRVDSLPSPDGSARVVCLFLAAHEIRRTTEQGRFFGELRRLLAADGRVCVTEHLRDLPNALVYTIGVFHFFSRRHWRRIFAKAGFRVLEERKENAFVSTFLLGGS